MRVDVEKMNKSRIFAALKGVFPFIVKQKQVKTITNKGQ